MAALTAVATLLAVGLLAVGAGHLLAPLVWHGGSTGLGVVRALIALTAAFSVGPLIILVLSAAFRRLERVWRL
jgi:hypothetical protein